MILFNVFMIDRRPHYAQMPAAANQSSSQHTLPTRSNNPSRCTLVVQFCVRLKAFLSVHCDACGQLDAAMAGGLVAMASIVPSSVPSHAAWRPVPSPSAQRHATPDMLPVHGITTGVPKYSNYLVMRGRLSRPTMQGVWPSTWSGFALPMDVGMGGARPHHNASAEATRW